MSSETALIAAARKGSVAAFTDLVRANRERLFRFLLTRSASYADAEDALQDTLLNAYRYLNSYDPRWRFSTWLYRIAINNLARLHSAETVEAGEIRDESSNPLAACIAASERENLWLTARRLLNDDVFVAMWLRYAEDMSVTDIAAVVDRSVSWTKVNLMRARKALDAAMNAAADDERNKAYG